MRQHAGDSVGDSGERPLRLAGAAIFGIAALAVYARLYFGIDFTDESYYVALPYAFSLGHRPLQDELAIHQFAGLMLVPAVKACVAWAGSSDGIVLYMRHLYFGVALLCAYLVTTRFGRVVGRPRATVFAAVLLAWIPFCIPALSYNTIAEFGLLAGLLLVAFGASSRRPRIDLFCGTFALATAAIAYPPLALVAIASCAAGVWLFRRSNPGAGLVWIVTPVLCAAAVWLVAIVIVALRYDAVTNLPRMIELNALVGTQGGGVEKTAALLFEFKREAVFLLALAAILAAAALAFARIRNPRTLALVSVLAGPGVMAASWLYVPHTEPFTTTTFLISGLGIAAVAAIRPGGPAHRTGHGSPLAIIGLASLFAGATILWSSANGLRNGALGLAPAALVGLGLLTRAYPRKPREATDRLAEGYSAQSFEAAALAFAASILVFEVLQLHAGVYRDNPIGELSVRIERGPYAGLHTTPARSRFIGELDLVLAGMRADNETVLFFDYFPAGYLFSDLRPSTAALWMFPSNPSMQGNRAVRPIYAAPLADAGRLPDLAIVMKAIPERLRARNVTPPVSDPVLTRLREAEYEIAYQGDFYTILRKSFRVR